jgi:hypothetical protein
MAYLSAESKYKRVFPYYGLIISWGFIGFVASDIQKSLSDIRKDIHFLTTYTTNKVNDIETYTVNKFDNLEVYATNKLDNMTVKINML